MLMKSIIFLCSILLGQFCNAQEIIPLYKGTAPGSLPVDDTERSTRSTAGMGRAFVTNVTRPTITVYLPKKINAAASAVIICPGGGYHRLSIEDGGYEAAQAFADSGIVAIVLKYRTWMDSVYTDYSKVPLQDLQQAVDMLYSNAAKWKIDTNRIGILGFSAGGHLTTMAATSFKKRKPAFTILVYPVISFLDSLTSKTSSSRRYLLGRKISAEEKMIYSPELHISNTTPPAFLIHASDDSTSLVGNSIAYYKGLIANKIPAQLLIYQKGGHGFAMYNREQDEYWMPAAIKWLAVNGFYKK